MDSVLMAKDAHSFPSVDRNQSRSGVHCCNSCHLTSGLPVSANHEASSGRLQIKILLTGTVLQSQCL